MPRIGGSVIGGGSNNASVSTGSTTAGGGANMSHYNMLLNNMSSVGNAGAAAGMTAGMTSGSGGFRKNMSTREPSDLDSAALAELLNSGGNSNGGGGGDKDSGGDVGPSMPGVGENDPLKSFYSKKQPNAPPKLGAGEAMRPPRVVSRKR